MAESAFVFSTLEPVRYPPTATFIDVTAWSDVEIQVINLAGSCTVQRSFDNINFVNYPVINPLGAFVETITEDGIYLVEGSCFLRIVGAPEATFYYRGGQ